MRWFSYTWRVLINLFYLIVVIAVLAGINNPMEKAIIAVLGLLYVMIASQAIMSGIAMSKMMTAVGEKLDLIHYHVDQSFELPDYREAKKLLEYTEIKLYIDGVGLFFISLTCLWAFFSVH